ncbi:MAG TPA: hypothetical protein ENG03_03030 [Thioploca sp.]|nr:MAG: hypothetical protein DRR19_12860 [Gammaproteobacteria bacterium]HDN26067.1 hypothetical protein [Thioploca sp.]
MNISKLISLMPLFAVILILYNVMVFFGVNFDECTAQTLKNAAECQVNSLFSLTLPSGKEWAPTWSSLILMLGVMTLYIELVKSTKTGSITLIEHALSMVVFIACLMEFILIDSAGTSTFLIITLMSLLDVVAGFTITVASARRDFTMGG